MPQISFVLPHWLYWGGLIFVPLMAMYIVRKQRGKTVDGVMSIPIAYLLWLCAGFAGLHRLYVKSIWGLVYIPIFVALLLFNVQVRSAVDAVSGVKNEVNIAEFNVERAQKDIDKGRDGTQQKMAKAKQTFKPGNTVTYTVSRPKCKKNSACEKDIDITLGTLPDEVLAKWVGSHMIDHAGVAVASN